MSCPSEPLLLSSLATLSWFPLLVPSHLHLYSFYCALGLRPGTSLSSSTSVSKLPVSASGSSTRPICCLKSPQLSFCLFISYFQTRKNQRIQRIRYPHFPFRQRSPCRFYRISFSRRSLRLYLQKGAFSEQLP